MIDAVTDIILLRQRDRPCKYCGHDYGSISENNGQACVFCENCGKWLYNAPKHERGLAPQPVRSEGVTPKVRYQVMERANFRCEFCGAPSRQQPMHIGHLLSEKDLRTLGVPMHFYDHIDNLAWLCDACNLGQGARSLPLHAALVFHIKRYMEDGDNNGHQ